MNAESPAMPASGDVPTLVVRDSNGRQLLCFLEELIPLDGHDYVLLTPVDTPVCLFRLDDDEDPELIDTIDAEAAKWLKAEIKKTFNVPVKYVAYSHDHPDHSSGGEVFTDTAGLIGHLQARGVAI